jgi:hypothetical protein
MSEGYAAVWVEHPDGTHTIQCTAIDRANVSPGVYNNLKEVALEAARSHPEKADQRRELHMAASLLCAAALQENEVARHVVPTSAALLMDLWNEPFFLVEGECVEHPIPTSDAFNSIVPGPSFEESRDRVFAALLYRIEKRISAACADQVEVELKKLAESDPPLITCKIKLAGESPLGTVRDSKGAPIDGSHRLAPFLKKSQ